MTIVQLDQLKARFSMNPSWSAGFDVGKQVRVSFPDSNLSAIAEVEKSCCSSHREEEKPLQLNEEK